MISLEEDMRAMDRALKLCGVIDRLCDRAKTRAVAGAPPGLSPSRSQAKPLIDYREGANDK